MVTYLLYNLIEFEDDTDGWLKQNGIRKQFQANETYQLLIWSTPSKTTPYSCWTPPAILPHGTMGLPSSSSTVDKRLLVSISQFSTVRMLSNLVSLNLNSNSPFATENSKFQDGDTAKMAPPFMQMWSSLLPTATMSLLVLLRSPATWQNTTWPIHVSPPSIGSWNIRTMIWLSHTNKLEA